MRNPFKNPSFQEWFNDFENVFENMISRFQEGQSKGEPFPRIPEGFEKSVLSQYIAYRNEIITKRLVWATWFLAGASIILSIITLFLN